MVSSRTCRRWRFALSLTLTTALSFGIAGQSDAADAPADSLARLKSGNARFVANASEALPITAPRRAALAQGQSPFASVLSCSDSRVPPEVIFHTGLGDLFVVRSAGHVSDRSVLASLEYGVEHLHTPLLVVMGHESCGAVKAAVDTPASTSLGPNLDYLLKAIRPAVARSANQPAEIRLRAAILANVEETINQLLETSQLLKRMAENQQLVLVGAYYELASGRVYFSEPARVLPRSAPPARPTSAAPRPASPTTPAASSTVPAASAVKAPAGVTSATKPTTSTGTVPASTTRPASH
jgi:carbonic anhydrase